MKKFFVILLLIILVSHSLRAAVAFDAVASAACGDNEAAKCVDAGGGNFTLTYSLTPGGTATGLAVFVSTACSSGGTAAPITAVTFNGVSLSKIIEITAGTNARIANIWSLPAGTAPASGAHNVVVTFTGDPEVCASSEGNANSGAITVTGIDTATTLNTSNSNSGSGTSATLTISASGANDLGVYGLCAGTHTSSTTETQRWAHTQDTNSCGSSLGATAAGGDTSFSATLAASDSWLIVGGKFTAAGAGGGSTSQRLTLMGVGP